SGAVSFVERSLPDEYAGRRLDELACGDDYRPVMVTRAGAARLATPSTMGQEGDVVLFAVRADAVPAFESRLGAVGANGAVGPTA
ncbi:MAG TPA: hypothetical protein VFP61_05260, partial [Acidimicrobiales bacterium]|nr:hypothetical protein [Acidimicrobiales bacterium]